MQYIPEIREVALIIVLCAANRRMAVSQQEIMGTLRKLAARVIQTCGNH